MAAGSKTVLKKDKHTIETSVPAEVHRLVAHGYVVQKPQATTKTETKK